jgi:hypothetical protein
MTETIHFVNIETTDLDNLGLQQIGVLTNPDDDLGYRAWGGKDSQGNTTVWLAKDQAAKVASVVVANLSGGNSGIVQHDSDGVVTGEASINALSDVLVATPANAEVLKYNATTEVWENGTFELALGEISDVELTGEVGGEILKYNESEEQWENGTLSLDDLSDVSLSSPTDGQVLTYNQSENWWENSDATGGSETLNDCYDAETGNHVITVDDGDVLWNLDDTASQFKIYFDTNSDTDSGFYIESDHGEYFRIRREVTGEGTSYVTHVESAENGGNLDYSLGCTAFLAYSETNLDLRCDSAFAIFGSENNACYFYGYGTSVGLNEAGALAITGYTATSIVGALNEIATSFSLDKAYNADTGERTINVDAGDVNYIIVGAYKVQVYQNPTGATTNTMFHVHADGTNWSSGSVALKITSDDSSCLPLEVNNSSSQVAYIDNSGKLYCTGILLEAGDSITLLSGSGSFTLGSTTVAPRLANLTSTQISALTPANGMLVYNTTTNKIQGVENGSWVNLV